MRATTLGLLSAVLVTLGCESPAPSPPAVDVPLTVGSIDEFNALLKKHEGKVVLVDFWATWCLPCIEAFPHTVKLDHKYRDQGLATIGVSLDDPESAPTVKAFLAAQGDIQFDNMLSRDGGSSKTMEAFDLDAAVPHYRLYDRTGKLVYSWNGLPDELEAKVQELLAK
jgi:thiol-disulfide isomerase/thioredoxin